MLNYLFMILSGIISLTVVFSFVRLGNIIFKPASYEDLPQIKKELKNSLVLLLVNGLFIGVVNVVLKKPENPVFVITLLPLGSLCLATPIYVTMWIAFIGFNKKRKK